MGSLESKGPETGSPQRFNYRDAFTAALCAVALAGVAEKLVTNTNRMDNPGVYGNALGPIEQFDPFDDAKVIKRKLGRGDEPSALRLVQLSDEEKIVFNYPVSDIEVQSRLRGDEVVPTLLERP